MYSVRVFDDNMFNEPILIEAVNEFTTVYFEYMVDRGINAEKGNEEDYYYIVDVSGTAPSSEQILEFLTSDEHIIEMYMATIRVSTGTSAMTDAELWSSMYAETYFDLAKLMVYGRDQEWMDTFGYCYFNTEFVFLFKLTKPLKGGDRLYYTTVKDGVENNEPRMLVYQDDYNGEFVLKFPDYEFTDNGSIELRLWEDKEMTHLLGYVEVIQT